LRPAGAVDRRHGCFVARPAMACRPVLGMPPLSQAVRPPALLRQGHATGCCGAGGHRSIHCCREMVGYLRLDVELVGLFTHCGSSLLPSFFLETERQPKRPGAHKLLPGKKCVHRSTIGIPEAPVNPLKGRWARSLSWPQQQVRSTRISPKNRAGRHKNQKNSVTIRLISLLPSNHAGKAAEKIFGMEAFRGSKRAYPRPFCGPSIPISRKIEGLPRAGQLQVASK